ncbi:MAG: glycosyltransferase [Thermodesulfobacteriota bacterium]
MNILMITANDPAGMGIAFTNAINRYSEHRCRLITSQDRYGIDFGKDIHLPDIHDDDFGEVEQLLKNADIIHFHMLSDENAHLGPLVIRDFTSGKKILHHHHGHPDYLINAAAYNKKYRSLNRKVIVSTPDLLQIAENATWVPNLVPINDTHYLPRFEDSLPTAPIKICQAPTRKFDKHTEVFRRVFQQLHRKYPHLEQVILERMNHLDCLNAKKSCHVVFDHMRGWFGISSLESLSQGKPVIAGLDDWNIKCIREFTGTDLLPWQVARDEKGLYSVLRTLIADRELRLEVGRKSREFMEQHWTEQRALRVLFAVYAAL